MVEDADLKGRVAVITGGVSGIGLAAVERFVELGAFVVAADLQDEAGKNLEARFPGRVRYIRADVTQDSDIEATVAYAVKSFGRLDIMFNNAGSGGDPSSISDNNADGFDATMVLLARACVSGHKYATKQFVAQGSGGAILSTASAAGLQGGWSSVGYTAAKHAVIGIVRQAAIELGPLGIRSNAIAPGIIMTPIMAKAFGVPPGQAVEFTALLADRVADLQPIRRAGQPRDVANAAAFLVSDAASFITGAVLSVDGGATAVTSANFVERATKTVNDFMTA